VSRARGFAVVADEVRTVGLAHTATTDEISQMIDGLGNRTCDRRLAFINAGVDRRPWRLRVRASGSITWQLSKRIDTIVEPCDPGGDCSEEQSSVSEEYHKPDRHCERRQWTCVELAQRLRAVGISG